jgi:hypothetical protein
MTRIHQHLRSRAGTSFTKACVQLCCAAMRPVVISQWNKQTGPGFQA